MHENNKEKNTYFTLPCEVDDRLSCDTTHQLFSPDLAKSKVHEHYTYTVT